MSLNAPVATSTTSTSVIRSFTSAPYAPMFCTALAPTSPGMADRFSAPYQPRSTQWATKSSHTSPAPTFTHTWLSSSATGIMPRMAEWRTVPLKSPPNSRLLPPPMGSRRSSAPARRRSASTVCRSSTEVYSTKKAAFTSIPKVLCGSNE